MLIKLLSNIAQGEAVDAGAGLGVLGIIGGDIADVVVAGLQALETSGDAGQVAGLIDAAEVVIVVGVVALEAGGVGEDHVGILLSLHFHLVEVTERDAEDDAAALTHQGVHGGAHLGVVLGNLVHDDQLGLGIHAQLLHGLGVVMTPLLQRPEDYYDDGGDDDDE